MTVCLWRTHVECDSDDIEAHGGVCDAAEGWRLKQQEEVSSECIVNKKWQQVYIN